MEMMFGGIYKGAKVLVTGNTGFKGSWLCLWLQQLGAEVIGLADAIPTSPALHTLLQGETGMKQYWVDVRDALAVANTIEKIVPDFVFHLAARSVMRHGFTDPLGTLAVNAMGTANVLDAVRLLGKPCQVVLITSDKCYTNQEWVYGYRETDALGGKDIYSASKASAEHIAHAYISSFFAEDSPVQVSTARSGNVIGGGDWSDFRVVPDFIRAYETGVPMQLRRPAATRPWLFVLEPLCGYLRIGQLLHHKASVHGESFNFGPLDAGDITVMDLLEQLNAQMSAAPLQNHVHLHIDTDTREAGLLKLVWDKAEAMLQWQPVLPFEQSVAFTAHWYKAYLEGKTDMLEFSKSQISDYVALGRQSIPSLYNYSHP